ncbi:MAG: hypothetical protein K8S54_15160 [Spirochaetia bacterium]|nr:hypothetical protein [Spirochaetia bacterium]
MPGSFNGAKYKAFVREKIPVRWHMSLILLGSALAGMIASKVMQLLGLHPLWLRYVLTALVSYVFFLIWIKVWLLYISPDRKSKDHTEGVNLDGVPNLSGEIPIPGESTVFEGAGGEFGGAGSSGSWGDVSESTNTALSESSLPAKGSFDLDVSIPDVDEGVVPLLIMLALGLVLAAVFGGAVFLVYQAPAILSEVALEFLLSAGLVNSAKAMSTGSWVGSVLSRTWIPFSLVTAVAAILGLVIGHFCPDAEKLMDAIRSCVL